VLSIWSTTQATVDEMCDTNVMWHSIQRKVCIIPEYMRQSLAALRLLLAFI